MSREAEAEEEVAGSRARCTYRVNGQVVVRTNDMFTAALENLPLEGVLVKVDYKQGPWWGNVTVRTDAQGRYRVVDTKNCNSRKVRVRVMLDSPELQVRVPNHLNGVARDQWYLLQETGTTTQRTFNLGTSAFAEFEGAEEFESVTNYRRALMYFVGRQLIDFLGAQPNNYLAYEEKVTISYPWHWDSAYANGITRIAHIGENSWRPDTIVHELMHLWNYQHNSGTTNWVGGGINGTHDCQEPKNIAFHEGFAEFSAQHLQFMMWGFRYMNDPFDGCHRSALLRIQ